VRLTGQMGDVMKESATTAVSWVRANSARLLAHLSQLSEKS